MIKGVDPDPRGAEDVGDRPLAPKPCARRIGSWWCTRTDEHVPAECTTPAERTPTPNLFDRGRARR